MVFRRLQRKFLGSTPEPAPRAPAPAREGLMGVLEYDVPLSSQQGAELSNGLANGLSFYTDYNDSRLQLAAGSFDEEMRKALYEVLFLLHVNDPEMEALQYTAHRVERSNGNPREVEETRTANLYVEGAPHGVRGLEQLSPVFREEYNQFIRSEMKGSSFGKSEAGHRPIAIVQSIGSIGTIGHKSGDSDLDLQVIFDLHPPTSDPTAWNDDAVALALYLEQSWRADRIADTLIREKRGGSASSPHPKEDAQRQIRKQYPLLNRYFEEMAAGKKVDLHVHPWGKHRHLVAFELMRLIKRNRVIAGSGEGTRLEGLLQERIKRIQAYIEDKYPTAEIYLFAYSVTTFRAGRYQSSLEFKESSGSAYELILNYDTLMPGIQFTPTIPAHFLFSGEINNDLSLYNRWMDCADFGKVRVFDEVLPLMVNIGPTPDIEEEYISRHGGAVYWEAFKASSGNLPKATLNLLRYEMLLDPRFRKSVIQLIKEPGQFNEYITKASGDEKTDERTLHADDGGLPNWFLSFMEFDHPLLLKDPWWLRYKALKIAFGEGNGVGSLPPGDRAGLSLLIDFAFALHVRISDVFTKPGHTRTFDSHREKVLVNFLEHAFPKDTQKRVFLEYIFAGEVRAVNEFESDLREQFRRSLARVQETISDVIWEKLLRKNQEVKLWRHYYDENFEPGPNVVPSTIMQHLMIPRGRLQIGYVPREGWTFRSLQRESGIGKRFDTFGVLDHLPDEVTLVEKSGFLKGLAECVLNGYYGPLNEGSLKQTHTELEFNRARMDMGDSRDNRMAYLRPDQVQGLLERIRRFFPPEKHHYMDFFDQDRRLTRILVCLNLWKFGRLSILARDNLGIWFCDTFDHSDLEEDAPSLQHDYQALIHSPSIHESLDRYLASQRLFVDQLQLDTWVNPNSVETEHGGAQLTHKEEFLSNLLSAAIEESHPKLDRGK